MASSRLTGSEERAWQAFLHAHHHVVGMLDHELREAHELTFAEYDVLLRLARAPEKALRMTDLADRVMMSPSGATRIVDRLVRRRLVARRTDAEDGRVALASLTEHGAERLRMAARTHLRGIREHFTGRLSEAQQEDVADALGSIVGEHAPH